MTDVIYSHVRETLDEKYRLAYSDYRDQLSENQIRHLVYGEMDLLIEELADAWSDARDSSASEYATDTVAAWSAPHAIPQDILDEVADEIRIDILNRDVSDPLTGTIDNTTCPLLSVSLIGEDAGYSTWNRKPPAQYLRSAGLPVTSRTVENMRNLIAETPSEIHFASVIFRTSMRDLWKTIEDPDAEVKITNPTVILGKPFTGGYWDAVFPGCCITVPRSSVSIDGDFGCSVDDCYGGYCLDGPPAVITESRFSAT